MAKGRQVRQVRQRGGKSRAEMADLYLFGDGTHDFVFDVPSGVDKMAARVAWPAHRALTWQVWASYKQVQSPLSPPGAALTYDRLSNTAADLWPGSPRDGLPSLSAVIDAVEADTAALDRWCELDPDVAAAIPELALYRQALITVEMLADEAGDDSGAAHQLARSWWEARRKDAETTGRWWQLHAGGG